MADRVFVMPDLGEGLEEGEILTWLVAQGETVELNQPLAEIETAKATVEVPSPFAGVIERLHGEAGTTVAVGAPLVTFSGVAEATGARQSLGAPATERPVRATPPVRRLAASLGVDLAALLGSGPQGRVTADDVSRAAAGTGAPTEIGADPSRAALARILSVQAAIPQVTTFRTVDCTQLQAFRKEVGSSPLPVVISAFARVAAAHPVLTALWQGQGVLAREAVNVGFAVDTAKGLAVPVVQDVPNWGLTELTAELRRLAHAARDGVLRAEDIVGATLAVSNVGSYGSEAGTPILSPGTSATMGLGVIGPRALVVDEQVVARAACTLSLTFDHRVVDGAAAGVALTDLVSLLQSGEGLRDLAR